jgi:hypothetical protein
LAAIIGVVTAWPVVYFMAFLAFMFTAFTLRDEGLMDTLFGYVFVAHAMTMLLGIGLLAFYVVHLFKNDSMPSDQRLLWMLVLFLGNFLAFPVYWYLHVWRGADRPNLRRA